MLKQIFHQLKTAGSCRLEKHGCKDCKQHLDKAKGKGHGTEPHLGTASHASTNTVFMIAFEDEAVLDTLVSAIGEANKEIRRASDRIRLFQLPLDRIV